MADEALQQTDDTAKVDEAVVEDQVADQAAVADDTDKTEATAPPTVEDIASRMGWVPKERFRGDDTKWKSADEFILAGKDIQERASRELKEIRVTLDTVARTSGAIMEERLNAQKAELERRHSEAVASGDSGEALKLAKDIDKIDARKEETARPSPAPDTEAWVAKNEWFTKDALARDRAIQAAEAYLKLNKDAPALDQLAYAETVVKREFPQLFPAPDKAPASVNSPARTSVTPKRGETAADLPKEAKDLGNDLVERGLIPNLDAYAKHYFAEQRKKA
jgi:hypothetical protein